MNLEEGQDQIQMIKNHLKELADYYFESFFDKHDIDNISLESGLKLLAEEVQHNEQVIYSLMDLLGLLILKCECFFQLSEDHQIKEEDLHNNNCRILRKTNRNYRREFYSLVQNQMNYRPIEPYSRNKSKKQKINIRLYLSIYLISLFLGEK